MDSIDKLLDSVRKRVPLVHFLTNYVTVNDCANSTLACGGSPIMADEGEESAQMTSICNALVINIGTANARTLESMLRAGRRANSMDIPILLDPAGAGASAFRNKAVEILLQEINFTVIKGNISEMQSVSGGIMSTRGVDAAQGDLVTEETLTSATLFARKLSVMTGAVVVITGPIDLITDSAQVVAIRNGHPCMPRITGTGCMLGGIIACFLGANSKMPLEAAAAATAMMGICGELAYEKMERLDMGLGSFRSMFIDFIGRLDGKTLSELARIELL